MLTNSPAVILIDFRYHLKDISVCNFDMHLFQNVLQLELHVALGLIMCGDYGMQNDAGKTSTHKIIPTKGGCVKVCAK